ncbi:MAG: Crp/Fnr family transcriptional regulator [Gammaproteobacteria bacterium]|nr:Crp/Fnr family transcriptional regulator [Gammaproteobacteria bacterium]
MDEVQGYAAELRRAYLFSQVSDEHLQSLIKSAQQVRLGAGEILFSHGQRAERFFLLREGLMKLFRVSPEGDEKIIEITQPGQTFAEAVLFMGTEGRYPVSAQAIHDSRLFAFHYAPFRELLTSSADACFGMLASLSRRLHMLVNQIESLTLQSATYRLVAYLLEQIPRDIQESPEVLLTTPKSAIAGRLAMQPETLSRILAKLRNSSLIDVHANHIILRDVQALRGLIHRPPPGES